MKKSNLLFLSLLIFVAFSCQKNDLDVNCFDNSNTLDTCELEIVQDADLYNEDSMTSPFILGAALENNCLEINFLVSGCNSEESGIVVYDSGSFELNNDGIPVRNIRIDHPSTGDCLAGFEFRKTTDLSELRICDYDAIIIRIDNYDQEILYEY